MNEELKPCAFCEAYKTHCQVDSINDKYQDKEDLEKYGKYMHVYTVALVQHHWYKKLGKRSAGRSTDYRNKGLGFKLNFCPECGRRLK
jgi:hypothetical protein